MASRNHRSDQPTGWGRPWHLGSWFTPSLAAGGLYGAAAVLADLGFSYAEAGWEAPAGAGAVGVLATLSAAGAVAAHDGQADVEMHPHAKAFIVSSTAAAASWLTWTCAVSPFHTPQVASLVAASLIGTIWYKAVRRKQISKELAKREGRLRDRLLGTEAATINGWFTKCGWTGVTLDRKRGGKQVMTRLCTGCRGARTMRPGPGLPDQPCPLCEGAGRQTVGYRLHLALPDTGVILKRHLSLRLDRFEAVAGLERAGSASLAPTTNPRHAIIDVDEADVLADPVPLPDDTSELSINKPFRLGLCVDGSELMIQAGEKHMAILGPTGAGKSNTVHRLIEALSRMPDCVIFVIDGKAGATARAWLDPWLNDRGQGTYPRPIIEYLAITPYQAHLMLIGIRAGIDYRVSLHEGGQSKTYADKDLPAVVVIGEEFAQLGTDMARLITYDGPPVTPAQVTKGMLSLVQMGRSEKITAALVAQGGTVGLINGPTQAQIRTWIAHGGFEKASDAQRVLPGATNRQAKELCEMHHPGSVMYRPNPRAGYSKARIDWIDHTDDPAMSVEEQRDYIPALARARSQYCRPLDYGTAKAMHDAIVKASAGRFGFFDSTEDGGRETVIGRWEAMRDMPSLGRAPGGGPATPAASGGEPGATQTQTRPQPAPPAQRRAQPSLGAVPPHPDPVVGGDGDTFNAFSKIVAGYDATAPEPHVPGAAGADRPDDPDGPDSGQASPRYTFVKGWLIDHGDGQKTSQIVVALEEAQLPTARETVQRMLRRMEAVGDAHQRPGSGPAWFPGPRPPE